MDNKTNVRGIPFSSDEIIAKELELGGMLFDESVFDTEDKRIACANVIVVLDKALRTWQERNFTKELPQYLDIGDKSWFYVPVHLFKPGGDVVVLRTRDKPAGLIGWFRVKRNFSMNLRSLYV